MSVNEVTCEPVNEGIAFCLTVTDLMRFADLHEAGDDRKWLTYNGGNWPNHFKALGHQMGPHIGENFGHVYDFDRQVRPVQNLA